MHDILSSQYGLSFHPFSPDVPVEALTTGKQIDSFLFRVTQQLRDGGFIAVTGEPGTGKSAVLRIVASRLQAIADTKVGIISRPQSSTADFYRELGHLFGISLSPHNRWAGSKALREQWLAHIDKTRTRPVVIVDEVQEMKAPVLAELRLLSSLNLDARALLTVILAGDERLPARLKTPDMLPILSRIRTHLQLGYAEPEHLYAVLDRTLEHAGRADLITDDVKRALSTHANGNLRAMMTMADHLLSHVVQHELARIDEQVFFDVFKQPLAADGATKPSNAKRRRA
ncbi:MAG TPA: AAA family ATPase [Polyangiales bacterium]|nr:AAA family ATPase [Polyangiales bacterium]